MKFMKFSPVFLSMVSLTMLGLSSARADITYGTILAPNQSATGVRSYDDSNVLLTGSYQDAGTFGLWWLGSLSTGVGTTYQVLPVFAGQTVTSSLYYGPNTAKFDPSLGSNIRVVGSYINSSGTSNHGLMYVGSVSGTGGTWTQIDMSNSAAGGTVSNTIPHSTMGNVVVGNYDINTGLTSNSFIYNITTGTFTAMTIGGSTDNITSAYGVWQNDATSYTIVGGSEQTGVNRAYMVDYDISTGDFTHLTYFSDGPPGVTHFEGVTGVDGGYNLIATTDSGAAFVSVERNEDGSFSDAVWTNLLVPGSSLTTGNTVIDNIGIGVYDTTDPTGIATYTAVVPEPGSWGLLGLGAAWAGVFLLRSRRSKTA